MKSHEVSSVTKAMVHHLIPIEERICEMFIPENIRQNLEIIDVPVVLKSEPNSSKFHCYSEPYINLVLPRSQELIRSDDSINESIFK